MSGMILYDPSVEPGSVQKCDGLTVRYVTAEDYYRAQVGNVTTVLAVFLNIAPSSDSRIPAKARTSVDDAVADEYWNRYQGCLLPPNVLGVIAQESNGADGLASLIEQARRKLLAPMISLDEAIAERMRIRVAILKHGINGRLTDRQLAIAEAVVDILLLQRATMEDVLSAEGERKPGETRAARIEKMEQDQALAFEPALRIVIRPEAILKAIPASMKAPLSELASRRTPFYVRGVFPGPTDVAAPRT